MKKTISKVTAMILMAAFVSIAMGNGGAMAIGAGQMFEDVPESHWAFESINSAYEKGIIPAGSGTLFEPDKSLTGAEFVQMITAQFDLPEPIDPLAIFADAGEENNRPITREEAASVLGTAVSHLGIMMTMQYIDLTGIFEDYHQVDARYAGAIRIVYQLGIMRGTTSITFAPKDPVTRAQAAVMLVRLMDTAERVTG